MRNPILSSMCLFAGFVALAGCGGPEPSAEQVTAAVRAAISAPPNPSRDPCPSCKTFRNDENLLVVTFAIPDDVIVRDPLYVLDQVAPDGRSLGFLVVDDVAVNPDGTRQLTVDIDLDPQALLLLHIATPLRGAGETYLIVATLSFGSADA